MATKISRNPGTSPLTGDGIQFGDGTALVSATNGVGAYGTWNINITGYSGNGIPAGYAVPFFNTSAPVGWTKLAINDAAFRLVSGAGGSTGGSIGFTTIFNAAGVAVNGSTSAVALNTGQIPTHGHSVSDPGHGHTGGGSTHSHTVSTPAHSHGVNWPNHVHSQYKSAGDHRHAILGVENPNFGPEIVPPPSRGLVNNLTNPSTTAVFSGASVNAVNAGIGSTTGSGSNASMQGIGFSLSSSSAGSGVSISSAGGGGTHNHTFSGNLGNLNVQYVDLIICRKN